MLKPLLLNILETGLKHYLALDPDSGYFLKPIAGKVIALTVEPFNETVFLCPTENSIQILDHHAGEPDTKLSGSLPAFGMMALSDSPMRTIFSGEITITGDMHTGKKFQQLFAKLDIDWEEQLSHYTGDIVAHQIGQVFRVCQTWGQQSLDAFKLDAVEFLQEETRDLPATPETDSFYRQVDDLRLALDRLQSRTQRLETTLTTKPETPG